MPTKPLSDEVLQEAVAAKASHGTQEAAAASLGLDTATLIQRLRRAAERGLMSLSPVMEGYAIKSVASKVGDAWVKQTKEHGELYELPEGHSAKGYSTLVDSEGRKIQEWIKTDRSQVVTESLIRTVVDELKKELPRVRSTFGPAYCNEALANQFTVTDSHFGMLADADENGDADYNIKEAEKLLLSWFGAAIAMAPNAKVAIFAQLADLMHHDSLESVTPAHRHVLDADSRLQKVIRVVIRVIRQIIGMLLAKHEFVHVVMASGNHDPASSAWMRELLHAMYEDEPRITIDNSSDIYYAYEHGRTGLFYHHGHKKGVAKVDDVFVGKFKEIYGRCLQCYGHVGHLHSDAVVETNLMRVERHRTLAPADAYSANGGWISGRDAKVITYHKQYGEVNRITVNPMMLAANDNHAPLAVVAA